MNRHECVINPMMAYVVLEALKFYTCRTPTILLARIFAGPKSHFSTRGDYIIKNGQEVYKSPSFSLKSSAENISSQLCHATQEPSQPQLPPTEMYIASLFSFDVT